MAVCELAVCRVRQQFERTVGSCEASTSAKVASEWLWHIIGQSEEEP